MDTQKKKEPRLAMEIRGVPDKKVYNKNYGFPYRIVRWCCIPGIAYYILGLILARGFHILIPGAGNAITAWILGIWITASVAGIPISYLIAHISFKRIKNDYLIFKRNSFLWHRQMLRERVGDELVERDDDYTVFEISNKSSETKGYFKISGNIEHVGIRNGKRLKPLKVTRITIPKAFTHMDEIRKYPFVEDTVIQHRMMEEMKRRKEEKMQQKLKAAQQGEETNTPQVTEKDDENIKPQITEQSGDVKRTRNSGQDDEA